MSKRGGVEDTRLEAESKPRTQKKPEAKAKDSPSEDRLSRGQDRNALGQGPTTQAQVFSKKKRGLQKIFSGDLKKKSSKKFSGKKVKKKFFSGDLQLRKIKKGLQQSFARFLTFSNKILTVQKIVLSSSRGQSSFRGASRPRPKT